MTNPISGDVAFESGGVAYTFKIGTNAMVLAERALGESMMKIAQRLQDDPSVDLIQTVFWAGLKRAHPALTVEAVGDLMDEIGFDRVNEVIAEAFALSQGPKEDASATARPRRARARAGDGSVST